MKPESGCNCQALKKTFVCWSRLPRFCVATSLVSTERSERREREREREREKMETGKPDGWSNLHLAAGGPKEHSFSWSCLLSLSMIIVTSAHKTAP